MVLKYKYIYFELVEEKLKTKVYSCRNNKSNIELGVIKWHPSWRQYCYFPTVQAVYSNDCLLNIIDFINQLKEQKE